jgi:thiamine-monophosphate kinase
MLGEFDIIRHYFSRDRDGSGVVVGVGDDGAVLAATPGMELVVVVDTLVQGIHYPDELAAADIAYRAVAVNLSDIAAMGGQPRWMTLALTLSRADGAWLEGFASGLYAASRAAGVYLVGGDTTRGECTVITVEIIGEVAPGRALRRSGARPGDDIFVSGTIGDAAAGLRQLQAGASPGRETGLLAAKFRRPAARLELGRSLAGCASAAIDVSDGLHDDLGKLLAASRCGGVIDLERLPLSAELIDAFPEDATTLALAGGDDYELCFTAGTDARAAVEAAAAEAGVGVTRIGEVVDGQGIVCRRDGVAAPVHVPGYDHFVDDRDPA